jgi:DNA replication protein DnaC
MVTKLCKNCGAEFAYPPVIVSSREIMPKIFCDVCTDEFAEKRRNEIKQAKLEAKKAEWSKICPATYNQTDENQLDPKLFLAAQNWGYGPTGLGFVGPAGTTKTRCAFWLLRKWHFAGLRVAAINAAELSSLSAKQFSDQPEESWAAKERIKNATRCPLLFLDDIGKGKLTERAESDLYALLEHRTSNMLPTIWTANANAKKLGAILTHDRAEPILRRLTEFSEIHTTTQK